MSAGNHVFGIFSVLGSIALAYPLYIRRNIPRKPHSNPDCSKEFLAIYACVCFVVFAALLTIFEGSSGGWGHYCGRAMVLLVVAGLGSWFLYIHYHRINDSLIVNYKDWKWHPKKGWYKKPGTEDTLGQPSGTSQEVATEQTAE
ncbi:hypothetical protein MHLP_04465 [Candidatus Mycoplasma haematolamae str. Purdue]|uniref:Uncharacterized protein n=1 Tax=Mycoplasma haematolamae (strain Purdue) TaxID=1212765 RepID=I7BKP9_MYCHA|nr:hypothetical protein [Candidatus Mycoplasma haematolamae]AFO52473.1 hypothetical protein MHLP_04465 [Candidatus Mycoplasma haematolamae str. Purdue]